MLGALAGLSGSQSPIGAAGAEGQTSGAVPRDVGSLVEIRSYNLKAGTRDRFHEVFVREALPMLHRWHVDVV